MAEYLVSSCGFDPDQAAEASKLLGRIESRHHPDSVLGLFKSYGFDNTQVIKVISANPRLLLLDVEKTLAPKFRALQDLGFSCSDITHLDRSNNAVISHKSQTILSKIQLWQGLLGSNDFLVNLCKKNRWFLAQVHQKKRIQPNIEMLRDCGVMDRKLTMILRLYPCLIIQKAEALKALISRVENLVVARTSGMLFWTLKVLHTITEKNFKAHLEFFKGFGWSEDDFLAAFRKNPALVGFSLKSLQRKMEFLVNEDGCAPTYLALRPKKFLEKFVIRHKEFPELIELTEVCPWSLRSCNRRPLSGLFPNIALCKLVTNLRWYWARERIKICSWNYLTARGQRNILWIIFNLKNDFFFIYCDCSPFSGLVSHQAQSLLSSTAWVHVVAIFVIVCRLNSNI
ncbi:unnamed protein product [Musa textilis]